MSRSPYIVGRAYDWAFFLLPPLVSLLVGIAISGSDFSGQAFSIAGRELTGSELLIGTIVHAHLVAVFVRSHGNPAVRRRHRARFFLVPLLVWVAIVSSAPIAIAATLVATFWDVWHSGAQTFGFARMYDRNRGNPPEQGRLLDFWMNQLLYAGPILAGAVLFDHLKHFSDFEDVGITLFSTVPAYVEGHQRYLAWVVLGVGSAFLVGYVAYYVRLHRAGYRVSPQKVFLVASTGACSIYTWGFNSWGEAFFIMNLFHAVQYLALVWHAERPTLLRATSVLGHRASGKALTCAVYLGAVALYGIGAELVDSRRRALWAVTVVVSLMHFWYDGFVWSVRRSQV